MEGLTISGVEADPLEERSGLCMESMVSSYSETCEWTHVSTGIKYLSYVEIILSSCIVCSY